VGEGDAAFPYRRRARAEPAHGAAGQQADRATVPKARVAIIGHATPEEFRANPSAPDVAGDNPAPRACWKDELHGRLTALSTTLELIESFARRAVP
jgi:hypothetical protein